MIPRRMNLVAMKIKQQVRSAAIIDSEYRQPLPKQYNPTLLDIQAQIKYTNTEKQQFSMTGDEEKGDGRIVVRNSDIERNGWSIQKGDLIVEIAGQSCEYKIIEDSPRAHLNTTSHLTFFPFVENKYTRNSV